MELWRQEIKLDARFGVNFSPEAIRIARIAKSGYRAIFIENHKTGIKGGELLYGTFARPRCPRAPGLEIACRRVRCKDLLRGLRGCLVNAIGKGFYVCFVDSENDAIRGFHCFVRTFEINMTKV